MRRISQLVSLVLLTLSSLSAHATPVSYGLEFVVEYFGCAPPACGNPPLDPRVQIGNTYSGSFIVDDAVLTSEGMNKAGSVSAFRVQFENVVWDSRLPTPLSDFSGFRGPTGLYSPSPGFDVAGGELSNVRGGVFGGGDFPFVDFSTDARLPFANPCGASSLYCGNSSNAFWTINPLGAFGGKMLVYRVPEPSMMWSLVLGLIVAHISARRRTASTTK